MRQACFSPGKSSDEQDKVTVVYAFDNVLNCYVSKSLSDFLAVKRKTKVPMSGVETYILIS